MKLKVLAAITCLGTLLAGGAQAQSDMQICRDQSQRLALGGEGLTDFMAYCSARQAADRPMAGERWLACQQKTRGASGRGAGDNTHTPQQSQAMKDCMEGR